MVGEQPNWATCDHDGCSGSRVANTTWCLAHADSPTQDAELKRIGVEGTVDARGVPLTAGLLQRILAAAPREDDRPTLALASFDQATFQGGADFGGITFQGPAVFAGAMFEDEAGFTDALFHDHAEFSQVAFQGRVELGRASFQRTTRFARVTFQRNASFDEAQFLGDVEFGTSVFAGPTSFRAARFDGDARFGNVQFLQDTAFGSAAFLGSAWFGQTRFGGRASFAGTHFMEFAAFLGAQFKGEAEFVDARFDSRATFVQTRFIRRANFGQVSFEGRAAFDKSYFGGDALFGKVRFQRGATFLESEFIRDVEFTVTLSYADVRFNKAQFRQGGTLGPLLTEYLALDGATFKGPMLIEVNASRMSCLGTRFSEGVTLRVRYAEIAMDGSVLGELSTIAFARGPFRAGPQEFNSELVPEPFDANRVRPRLLSLRRVDASTLVLADLDLRCCLFAGAHNMDKLSIQGSPSFIGTPAGWKFGRLGGQGLPVWRWTQRQVLAEEHRWRAERPLPPSPGGRPHPKRVGWYPPQSQTPDWVREVSDEPIGTLDADRLATLYRALRKAQEDNKNEPGAADFYFGEMEMRRKANATPGVERFILTAYWFISGYALRAWRALAAIVVLLALAAWLLISFDGIKSPTMTYWAALRYSARTTIGLLPKDQPVLSPVGDVLQIAIRVIVPVLLGLAVLSVRGRVKR
jgi:hypothetical protein